MEKFNEELRSESNADFPVLSDMDNGYALLLNLAFYVGDEKQKFMKAAGWNISPFQGNDNWTLPIPATFVVGRSGLVAARFVDPDYRKRMDIEALLNAIKNARI
jgi:peroxiredoxin